MPRQCTLPCNFLKKCGVSVYENKGIKKLNMNTTSSYPAPVDPGYPTSTQAGPNGARTGRVPMFLKAAQGGFLVVGAIILLVGMMKMTEYQDAVRQAQEGNHKLSTLPEPPSRVWIIVGLCMIGGSMLALVLSFLSSGRAPKGN
jgi:hypothetical protein